MAINKYYKAAYEIGKRAALSGLTSFDEACDSDYWPVIDKMDRVETAFFNIGLSGAEMPFEVKAWRYGKMPATGWSYNYRDGFAEDGLSVMECEGRKTQDALGAMFFTARPRVFVRGLLNTRKTGSDGEPLLLAAVEITEDEYLLNHGKTN